MKVGRPSDTAEAMAAARACGAHLYRREKILDDPFAAHFLGPRYAALYRLIRHIGRGPINLGLASFYDRVLPGAIGFILTRHRYFDDAIEEAVRGGATQIVFVGAGYDSRAFRQKALGDVQIIEVDHPDTQARKKRIVQEIFGALPKNVRYVSLNATQGDLRQLPEHGFDRGAKALFVLEGFIWYMPPDVARAILGAIVAIAAPGSQVIFDYVLPSVVDGSCRLEGAQQHRRYCARRGEPILFGIEPAQQADDLRAQGLRLIDDVGHEELRARYAGRSAIKIYPFLRIARAEVDPSRAAHR
jgi:methyltransferase (TIGR00027 family)